MNKKSLIDELVGRSLLVFLCMVVIAGGVFVSVAGAENQTQKDKKAVEVLYYDKASGVKIINKNNFLLKIEKNEKGLKIVQEIGPYPDAYPDNLPEPKTHIDEEIEVESIQPIQEPPAE